MGVIGSSAGAIGEPSWTADNTAVQSTGMQKRTIADGSNRAAHGRNIKMGSLDLTGMDSASDMPSPHATSTGAEKI
jgi:hypothetical protein